jgi:hypothetical protein
MRGTVGLGAAAIAALLMCAPIVRGQQNRLPGAVYDFEKKGEQLGPAPKRDLSGTWEPANGADGGIQGKGALAMESCKRDASGKYAVDPNAPKYDTGYATPDCLKPAVEPPYTELGRKMLLTHIPVEGYRMVPDALTNDPILKCDPGGFPRLVLHNFRTSEILQTPTHVVILYKFQKRYRQIWTDGRELSKDPQKPSWVNSVDALPPEPRWWGYSVGKWQDDTTFVVRTNGFQDDRTWLDNAGFPQSDTTEVEETYHRIDDRHLELTVKISDPRLYTRSWIALDKLKLRLQDPHFEIQEMECSPSDQEHWMKFFGDLTGVDEKDSK